MSLWSGSRNEQHRVTHGTQRSHVNGLFQTVNVGSLSPMCHSVLFVSTSSPRCLTVALPDHRPTTRSVVGKLDPKDPDTRCDGIVRGLKTPQRDTWYDVVVPDTGAISHAMDESAAQTLEKAEDKKLEKHGQRVALAENADFVPIACSVYGTTGFHCQQLIKTCTEKMVERKSAESSGEFSEVMCLNRARFQAAVWKEVARKWLGSG